MSNTPEAILKQYFGYDTFRGGQRQAVDALLQGQDVLCVMPTGAGKSVCYQVPAMALPGLTLVISPLISLMKDQVASLTRAGIPAAYLNSALTDSQFRLALSRMAGGLPVREIMAKVERGELQEVWKPYLKEVCAGLLGLMAICAPSVIAIGGGLSNSGDTLLNGILNTLNETEAYPRLYHYVQVCLGTFRNDAGVIGAAALARNAGKE